VVGAGGRTGKTNIRRLLAGLCWKAVECSAARERRFVATTRHSRGGTSAGKKAVTVSSTWSPQRLVLAFRPIDVPIALVFIQFCRRAPSPPRSGVCNGTECSAMLRSVLSFKTSARGCLRRVRSHPSRPGASAALSLNADFRFGSTSVLPGNRQEGPFFPRAVITGPQSGHYQRNGRIEAGSGQPLRASAMAGYRQSRPLYEARRGRHCDRLSL
jgi:hypothetical protein